MVPNNYPKREVQKTYELPCFLLHERVLASLLLLYFIETFRKSFSALMNIFTK